MPITLQQRHTLSVGATRLLRINATNDLDDGSLFTGTPTIVEVTTSDLTLSDKAVNAATYSDNSTGATVAIGKGLEATVLGGTAGTTYTVRATCATDSSPAETLVYDLLIDWI